MTRQRSVFGALVALALTSSVATTLPAHVHADGPVATLELEGHGYGHGVGLSQWGAYGYAANYGWSAAQILDHYYGGTVSGTTDATTMTVRLMALDDQQTAVVHPKGALVVDGVGGPWPSVVAREVAPGSYTVWARGDGQFCPAATDPLAEWTAVASGLPSVNIHPQTDTSASTDVTDLAAVCEPSGRVRTYRGTIRAINGTAGENRTVNELPLEQYLRPVVATEMSASWAPQGSAALQAQAVAARSYGLAENRYSYAKTCDLVCQYYPGVGWRQGVGGTFNKYEQPAVDVNVQATAAVVRRVGSPAGPIALTMFSASSGGWTAASSLPFPAVEDLGDATPGNPNHTWQTTLSAGTITAKWPSIGAFTGITVTARSGQGDWGGRVVSMTVNGDAGSVTLTGDAFRSAMGLKSNWFAVRGTPSTAPTPAPPVAPGAPSAPPSPFQCDGRDAPPATAQPSDGAPARFQPIVPVRLIDTRDGTGTDARPLATGCTLVVRPTVPPGTTAVAINIVTVDPRAQGFITAYPCDVGRTYTSVVQSQVGHIVSGSAIVPIGGDGTFCVFSNVTTEVVIDMTGSFSATAPDRYEPIVTTRLFDSRPSGRLPAGTVVRVPTRGPGRAAADSTGASLTIHALDPAYAGFVTVWPCDAPRPWASSANVDLHGAVANYADIAVSDSGEACVFISAPMDIAVDLNGWYGPSATADFHAVTPFRIADTREGQPWSGPFVRDVGRTITVAGLGSLPGPGVTRSVAVQLTAVDGSRAGWFTVHPCLDPAPDVSMLRYVADTNVAVLVNTVLDAAGRWCVVTNGSSDLVIDVSGWFG
ncbi:MAG: SpoIID/LytB domain-containing protein [Ilumatobacteraceae bacterium]